MLESLNSTPYAVPLLTLGLAPFALYLAVRAPLIFPFGLYVMMVPFDFILGGGNGLMMKLTVVAASAALAFRIIWTKQMLTPTRAWLVWLVFLALTAASTLWSLDPVQTGERSTTMVQIFILYTLLAIYPIRPGEFRGLIAVSVASGFVGAVFGLIAFMEGDRFQTRLSIATSTGIVTDPNHVAASLLLPIGMAVAGVFVARTFIMRAGSLIALLTMTSAVLLAASRGATISIGFMLLFIAWRTRYRLQIIGVTTLVALLSLGFPQVWNRFNDPTQGAGAGRVFIWQVGLAALRDHNHWLYGAGAGLFPEAYNRVLLSLWQPVFAGWDRASHNVLVGTAVELGIFGAALVLYGWWLTYADVAKLKGSGGDGVMQASIAATVVGLAITSFFLDTLIMKYLWLAFSMAALAKNVAEPTYLLNKGKRMILPRYVRRRVFVQRTPAPRGEEPGSVLVASVSSSE